MIEWLRKLFDKREDPRWSALTPRQKSVVQTWKNLCFSEKWECTLWEFEGVHFIGRAINSNGTHLKARIPVATSDLHGEMLAKVNVDDQAD